MTEAIIRLIGKAKNLANQNDDYTVFGDEVSQKWLQNVKIVDKIRLFPDLYGVWIIYENEDYLVLVNHNEEEFHIPDFLDNTTDINSGCWIAIIDDLDISLKKNIDISRLVDVFGYSWKTNSKGFKEIKFDESVDGFKFKDFFPDITLYKIISKFTQKEELSQILGSILVTGNTYRLLPYTQSVIQEFKNIFDNGNKNIPFDNLLASYVASEFKFAYLDLYRCMERLQPLYFFSRFYKQLSLNNKSLLEFCEEFYDTTKLSPSLEKSLEALLKSLPEGINATKDLYQIRNHIVHLRPNQSNNLIPHGIQEWNELILNILTIVKELYDTHQALFEVRH